MRHPANGIVDVVDFYGELNVDPGDVQESLGAVHSDVQEKGFPTLVYRGRNG